MDFDKKKKQKTITILCSKHGMSAADRHSDISAVADEMEGTETEEHSNESTTTVWPASMHGPDGSALPSKACYRRLLVEKWKLQCENEGLRRELEELRAKHKKERCQNDRSFKALHNKMKFKEGEIRNQSGRRREVELENARLQAAEEHLRRRVESEESLVQALRSRVQLLQQELKSVTAQCQSDQSDMRPLKRPEE